jgi:signal transduction histidine kinase
MVGVAVLKRLFRPPVFVVAIALVGLIALLAVLQYRWLGQISDGERERTRTRLSAGATEFAQDFDRELTRAYLLFQLDVPGTTDAEIAERFGTRYDRWQSSARFPRLLKDYYIFTQPEKGEPTLRRFDPATRTVAVADWPASMANWREHIAGTSTRENGPAGSTVVFRSVPSAIWASVPALVVPMPMVFVAAPAPDVRMSSTPALSIVTIDLDYVKGELLPSLADRYFSAPGGGLDYQVAVVEREPTNGVVFQSTAGFAPASDAPSDAAADLFQVRMQDFTTLASEVRRFTTAFSTSMHGATFSVPPGKGPVTVTETRPLSILIQRGANAGSGGLRGSTSTRVTTTVGLPFWRLLVKHPSGSLEAAVDAQRRRNLVVSSSILALLGASMGLLVLSTRTAQRLAKQQMEFVAAVSHELRTPLAVIRSAAENLADGVVHDDAQIKRYGELMRTEGRRLTDMVEQILELAGIQSEQRGFALHRVAIEPLLRDIVSASSDLLNGAGMEVELELPSGLPPVAGDEPALRRVFQNLIDNAIKYGVAGGWIGLSARRVGTEVWITVADRGIGIEPAEQSRIFEPFYRAAGVVAAQTQGAGLGLSLVQRIVVAHGGRITVKSAPGAGSEFTVQLPAASEEAVPIGHDVTSDQPVAS